MDRGNMLVPRGNLAAVQNLNEGVVMSERLQHLSRELKHKALAKLQTQIEQKDHEMDLLKRHKLMLFGNLEQLKDKWKGLEQTTDARAVQGQLCDVLQLYPNLESMYKTQIKRGVAGASKTKLNKKKPKKGAKKAKKAPKAKKGKPNIKGKKSANDLDESNLSLTGTTPKNEPLPEDLAQVKTDMTAPKEPPLIDVDGDKTMQATKAAIALQEAEAARSSAETRARQVEQAKRCAQAARKSLQLQAAQATQAANAARHAEEAMKTETLRLECATRAVMQAEQALVIEQRRADELTERAKQVLAMAAEAGIPIMRSSEFHKLPGCEKFESAENRGSFCVCLTDCRYMISNGAAAPTGSTWPSESMWNGKYRPADEEYPQERKYEYKEQLNYGNRPPNPLLMKSLQTRDGQGMPMGSTWPSQNIRDGKYTPVSGEYPGERACDCSEQLSYGNRPQHPLLLKGLQTRDGQGMPMGSTWPSQNIRDGKCMPFNGEYPEERRFQYSKKLSVGSTPQEALGMRREVNGKLRESSWPSKNIRDGKYMPVNGEYPGERVCECSEQLSYGNRPTEPLQTMSLKTREPYGKPPENTRQSEKKWGTERTYPKQLYCPCDESEQPETGTCAYDRSGNLPLCENCVKSMRKTLTPANYTNKIPSESYQNYKQIDRSDDYKQRNKMPSPEQYEDINKFNRFMDEQVPSARDQRQNYGEHMGCACSGAQANREAPKTEHPYPSPMHPLSDGEIDNRNENYGHETYGARFDEDDFPDFHTGKALTGNRHNKPPSRTEYKNREEQSENEIQQRYRKNENSVKILDSTPKAANMAKRQFQVENSNKNGQINKSRKQKNNNKLTYTQENEELENRKYLDFDRLMNNEIPTACACRETYTPAHGNTAPDINSLKTNGNSANNQESCCNRNTCPFRNYIDDNSFETDDDLMCCCGCTEEYEKYEENPVADSPNSSYCCCGCQSLASSCYTSETVLQTRSANNYRYIDDKQLKKEDAQNEQMACACQLMEHRDAADPKERNLPKPYNFKEKRTDEAQSSERCNCCIEQQTQKMSPTECTNQCGVPKKQKENDEEKSEKELHVNNYEKNNDGKPNQAMNAQNFRIKSGKTTSTSTHKNAIPTAKLDKKQAQHFDTRKSTDSKSPLNPKEAIVISKTNIVVRNAPQPCVKKDVVLIDNPACCNPSDPNCPYCSVC